MTRTAEMLAVELAGIRMKTPLMPASGTLSKEALAEVQGVYGIMLPKTVTPSRREGNPPPRIAETPSGMINSIGLQNPGIDDFLQDLDAFGDEAPLMVSVAGDTVAEFEALCRRLAPDERITAVEMNLSCPNVEHGGLTFCAAPESVAEVVGSCREAYSQKPIFVKLTNEGVLSNAVAAEESGADGLTLINTLPALSVDAWSREILKGGLSGPSIKPVALRAVYETASIVGIPVIGCGGLTTGHDVAEFMLAGASAVQVGTASFVRDPKDILEEFCEYLRKTGQNAGDLTGALQRVHQQ
ncbi:dihydroorotate dehydrogenase [soil metagenome]